MPQLPMPLSKTLAATVCAMLLGAAQAQSISASDIKNDYDNASFSTSFNVLAYSPWDTTPELGLKTQDGYTGVGVQGATNGEIDWRSGLSESITVDLANPAAIASITLGLLFNGPEYSDVREVARITVNGSDTYSLRTGSAENVAAWYHGNTFLANVNYIPGAGTQSGEAGAITLWSPFGNTVVDTIAFAADFGVNSYTCGAGTASCTNQSDYNVVNVTAVPEPQTYALLLAGLGAVGFVARRRRANG